MRKLNLNVESLQVETFATEAGEPADRGTVRGHHHVDGPSGGWGQCTHYGTCQDSCVQTCGGPTCEPPCDHPPTFYLTCGAGCSWTDGAAVCKQQPELY